MKLCWNAGYLRDRWALQVTGTMCFLKLHASAYNNVDTNRDQLNEWNIRDFTDAEHSIDVQNQLQPPPQFHTHAKMAMLLLRNWYLHYCFSRRMVLQLTIAPERVHCCLQRHWQEKTIPQTIFQVVRCSVVSRSGKESAERVHTCCCQKGVL